MQTITLKSILDNSKSYQYVDDGEPMRGGMKEVYFSPDKSYVVAFYRTKLDFNEKKKTCVCVKREEFFKDLSSKLVLNDQIN